MVMLARYRSITLPIVLASVSVVLSIGLLVGWTYLVVENVALSHQVVANSWLLVAGNLAFIIIMTILILFSIFQVRVILEGRRQISFIDSVTHELRSPLASLKLSVQTLERRKLTDQQRDRLHHIMIDDLDRLSAFIDDILEASRLGEGMADHQMVEIDLAELVERTAGRVRRRFKAPDEAIRIEVPEGLRLVSDPTCLETVLRNVLDNAVKYSDEPVEVVLRAKVLKGERVSIEVRDQGIGIPPDQLRRVFQRFYRVDTESVRRRRGTGLGLFVVSSLVHTLGGELGAESDGLGLGTTMRITLPLAGKEGVSLGRPRKGRSA